MGFQSSKRGCSRVLGVFFLGFAGYVRVYCGLAGFDMVLQGSFRGSMRVCDKFLLGLLHSFFWGSEGKVKGCFKIYIVLLGRYKGLNKSGSMLISCRPAG